MKTEYHLEIYEPDDSLLYAASYQSAIFAIYDS